MKEPCLCGATDCPSCYPGTWKENLLRDRYEDENTGQSFEEWKAEYKDAELEYKLDQLDYGR